MKTDEIRCWYQELEDGRYVDKPIGPAPIGVKFHGDEADLEVLLTERGGKWVIEIYAASRFAKKLAVLPIASNCIRLMEV